MCCATLDWICVAISSVATIEFVGNGLNLVWLLNLAWQSYLTDILCIILKVFEGIFFQHFWIKFQNIMFKLLSLLEK